MNDLVLALGLQTWKPYLLPLLLPPVPWLALIGLGIVLVGRQRRLGTALTLAGAAAVWAGCTTFVAEYATHLLLEPPEALDDDERAALKAAHDAGERITIVVLGGGRDAKPEYDRLSPSELALQRLRYGIWLSRATGIPVGFSAGVGPGFGGPTEAAIARRVAAEEFRHPLSWIEDESSDTRENAIRTTALLQPRGITRLVLVTHQAHMPRALRDFQRASAAAHWDVRIVPAPVGLRAWGEPWMLLDFLPSDWGWLRVRYAVREWLGLVAGA